MSLLVAVVQCSVNKTPERNLNRLSDNLLKD